MSGDPEAALMMKINDYAKWVISGILGLVCILVSALWFTVTSELAELRSDVKALSVLGADEKSDIKILQNRVAEVSDSLAELRGASSQRQRRVP